MPECLKTCRSVSYTIYKKLHLSHMAEVRVAMHLTRSYLYFTCAFVLRILCFYFNYLVSCFSGCTT